MTGHRLVDQELVIHAFASADGPRAGEAYAQIRGLWAGCRRRLGMTEPIRGTRLPTDLPAEPHTLPAAQALAAQENATGYQQAILRRHHDLLTFSLVFAQPPGNARATRPVGSPSPTGWISYDYLWEEIAAGGTDALLGVARIYQAKVADAQGRLSAAPPELAQAARTLLPPADQDDGWWDRGLLVAGGFACWEFSPRVDTRPERRMVVLAPADRDAELSAWTWSRGDVAAPPLARYLTHAAKVRYELRVYNSGEPVGRLHSRAERSITELRPLLGAAPAGPRQQAAQLAAANQHLVVLEADEADMVIVTAALRQMKRTVEIAASNMAEVLHTDRTATHTQDPFNDDQALATWFIQQLDDDAANLDAALERTHRLGDLLRDVIRRLQPRGTVEVEAIDADSRPHDISRNVFVVHGRDEQVRERMFDFLRALDLKPLEWELLVAATGSTAPFLGDVVQQAPRQAQATVVLLTPDDVVSMHPDLHGAGEPDYETRPVGQPRPNVLFELGSVLMAYPHRTVIVEIGRLRPIADLAGRNVIRFDGSTTSIGKIVERLKLAGCAVDDKGSDWRSTARFADLTAFGRAPP